MTKKERNFIVRYAVRSVAVFLMAAFLIVSFGGASIVGPLPMDMSRRFVMDQIGTQTLRELSHLGLLKQLSQTDVEALLAYQASSNKSLVDILREPAWLQRTGLVASTYKATWYAANPFDLLPVDLQIAIRKTQKPFETRSQMNRWLTAMDAPERWKTAIDLALVETTPTNLWRASRGKRPFAKNGQYLQPILVEKDSGRFEIKDGHIATDPRFIPTNSRLLIVVRVNGQDRILKVKATDTGDAIKGRHVDLPITLKPRYGRNHAIRFPGEYIRNPNILILVPSRKANRDQKA